MYVRSKIHARQIMYTLGKIQTSSETFRNFQNSNISDRTVFHRLVVNKESQKLNSKVFNLCIFATLLVVALTLSVTLVNLPSKAPTYTTIHIGTHARQSVHCMLNLFLSNLSTATLCTTFSFYILNPVNLTNHNPFQAKSNRLSGTSQNADIILQHCKVPRRADIIFLQHYKVPRRANIFMQTKTETKNKIQVSYQKHKHNHEE